MSRIFDALQRSERERTGTEAAPAAQGPELLKLVEHNAASEWTSGMTLKESVGMDSTVVFEKELVVPEFRGARAGADESGASSLERVKAIDGIKSLPISISSNSRLVCLTDRECPAAEALRLLSVRLRDIRRTRPLKNVLITSTIPQEGKSTIAANLSCALSHASEERVLLIEGDLRRPSLSKLFGIHSSSGICDCLRDQKPPLDSIYHLKEANLWIWPAGPASSNPLELLQSPSLHPVMTQLAKYFDWIIIDSPPVLPLADTSVWIRLADGILLVTRQGTTEKQQLKRGLDSLDRHKLLGALLNGTIASAYSGYYYRTTT
jgi:capsular exopolysaccharide synthesis family protein